MLANKRITRYHTVDADGQDKQIVCFIEDADYKPHREEGDVWWDTAYWVDLYDELGMVQVDEAQYRKITERYLDAAECAVPAKTFEEIFGDRKAEDEGVCEKELRLCACCKARENRERARMPVEAGYFLVFRNGNVYNKYHSAHEWNFGRLAILGFRGRQRVYGCILLHRPKERSVDHDIDRERNDRAAGPADTGEVLHHKV